MTVRAPRPAARPARPVRPRGRGPVAALFLAVLGLLLVVGTGPASAHASLVSVTPADGSSSATAPTTVTLRFDEPIRQPSAVVVTGPDGARADRGGVRVVDAQVAVSLAVAGPGRYTVAYRVVSADGHPVSGTTHFGYRGPALHPAPRPAAPGDSGEAAGSGGSGVPWVVVALVVLAVLVVGLAVMTLWRRGTRSAGTGRGADPDTSPDTSHGTSPRAGPGSDPGADPGAGPGAGEDTGGRTVPDAREGRQDP